MANAISNDDYCFWHSEKVTEDEKKSARIKGGQGGKIRVKSSLKSIEINETRDVVSLLGDSINRVRSGELDVKIANCLGYLSGQIVKAIEISELEQRLQAIEKQVNEEKSWL
jgi:hypothetical protein